MKTTWEKDINYGDLKADGKGYARTPDGGSIFVGVESDGEEENNGGGCGLATIIGIVCFALGMLVMMGGPR
jgi:hypothetical protein